MYPPGIHEVPTIFLGHFHRHRSHRPESFTGSALGWMIFYPGVAKGVHIVKAIDVDHVSPSVNSILKPSRTWWIFKFSSRQHLFLIIWMDVLLKRSWSWQVRNANCSHIRPSTPGQVPWWRDCSLAIHYHASQWRVFESHHTTGS